MTDPTAGPIHILLVEDNPGDARLTREALKDSKIHNTLDIVEDGVEGLRYLNQEGKYSDSERPDLILLDLDMPHKDGRELLEELKSDKAFRSIPIIIMTISPSDHDVLSAYDLHANCYIRKPLDLDQFIRVIQSIEDFWLTIVKLPQK